MKKQRGGFLWDFLKCFGETEEDEKQLDGTMLKPQLEQVK